MSEMKKKNIGLCSIRKKINTDIQIFFMTSLDLSHISKGTHVILDNLRIT